MKYIGVIIVFIIIVFQYKNALAYDYIWFDKSANIDRYQKVVVYPVALKNPSDFQWDSSEPFSNYNYELHKRLTRHVSGIKFYELFKMIDEKDALIPYDFDKFKKYLNEYNDETIRAKIIQDGYASDGYLTTYFYVRQKEIDRSPEIWTDLSLSSYTEEIGGPDGYRIYDMSTEVRHHRTPAKDSTRYRTEMQFILYDDNGDIVLTCMNELNSYKGDYDSQFKALKDDFVDFLKDVKRNKYSKNIDNKILKTIRINKFNIPIDINTIDGKLLQRTFLFAFEDESKKLKNVKLNNISNNNSFVDYYMDIDVKRMDYQPEWHKPYASKRKECISERESTWVDKNGNEHKMVTKKYADIPVDNFGYYDMSNARKLGMTIEVYNARNGELIFNQEYFTSNDKMMDALRDILKDFYKNLDKIASGKAIVNDFKDEINKDEVLMESKIAKQISFKSISSTNFVDKMKELAASSGDFEIVDDKNENEPTKKIYCRLKSGSSVDMSITDDESGNLKLIEFIVKEGDAKGKVIGDMVTSILNVINIDYNSFKKVKRYGDSKVTFKFKVKGQENRHYLYLEFKRMQDLRVYKIYASDEKM